MKVEPYQAGSLSGQCRQVGIQTFVLAGLAIGLVPFVLVADFFFSWAAVSGDTGVPPAPGAIDRETVCFVLAVAAAAVGAVAVLTVPWLPVSARGFTVRRVIHALAMGAVALDVIGLACVL